MLFLFPEDELIDHSYYRPIRTRAREYVADMHMKNLPGPFSDSPASDILPGSSSHIPSFPGLAEVTRKVFISNFIVFIVSL